MKTTGVRPVAFAFSTWSAVAVAAEAGMLFLPFPWTRPLPFGTVFVIEARLASWTTVYWGPVVEADVVLAALRAGGLPAELVYQSTGPGVVPGPGPTDSRIVVPDDYARHAAEIIARAGAKKGQLGATQSTGLFRTNVRLLFARVVAVLLLAGILWTVVNVMFPGLSQFTALP